MKIKIKVAVRCENAGRDYNEDNWFIDSNISDGKVSFLKDETISLGEKGALLLVCDGMGGMNAGEVASASAVNTIKEWFTADKLTEKVLTSSETIKSFIDKAITDADLRIKDEGKKDKSKEGMGTTIVLAWLYGEDVYVGWCGDSRAYRYNPDYGLERLSHDHSYVQELVDAGKLTEDMAFDHPDSNIITRSLGDPRQKIHPDIISKPLRENDVILLCSDGLWGVLRDNEIESVMAKHLTSMVECRDGLWNESERVGWTDNVTVVLCQIVSGGIKCTNHQESQNSTKKQRNQLQKFLTLIIFFLIVFATAFEAGHYIGKGKFWIPSMNMGHHNSSLDSLKVVNNKDSTRLSKDTLINQQLESK